MAKNRFFSPQKLASGAIIELSESAAIHAVRVLRLQVGNKITVFNGDGHDYEAEIVHIRKLHVEIKVSQPYRVTNESAIRITLLQGLSSGDRMDYTIQKAVELGVFRIQPLFTERSVVKLTGERTEKRIAHWQQVAISACEQCGRAFVPEIVHPISLTQWLSEHALTSECRILLNPAGETRLQSLKPSTADFTLLIGSEGGLSPDEIALSTSHEFQSVTLGPRILRTETAALTAIAAMQTLWGDF